MLNKFILVKLPKNEIRYHKVNRGCLLKTEESPKLKEVFVDKGNSSLRQLFTIAGSFEEKKANKNFSLKCHELAIKLMKMFR